MALKEMLRSEATTIEEIAAYLDDLAQEERSAQMLGLGRGAQRALWQRAASSEGLRADHFVPEDRAALTPVHHRGRNTLPLPRKHQFFEKRFCRPSDEPAAGAQRLFGYNESPSKKLIGPGYFVAVPTEPRPEWHERGALVVDYYQVPDASVAPGWPRVVPNSAGLQRFVYKGTRDFMRGVSRHVSIGAAYKGERALDHYFVLVREDVS